MTITREEATSPSNSSIDSGRSASVAFVLSGGGSLGAVQVGMLRALYERDITPGLLVATSAGAINAAFIASRPPVVETTEELADIWIGLRRREIFPINPVTELLGVTGARSHLVPERGLRELLRAHLGLERLEEATIPLHVIATDVFTGAERRLSEGDAVDAVMASAAIPAVFPPVEWEDTELVDGGVANNTPISHAVELGASTVYVLPTGYSCALDARPHGALGMAIHALTLLTQQRLLADVARMRNEVELIVLPPPCPIKFGPADFGHAEELIERAYADAGAHLTSPAARQGTVPDALHSAELMSGATRSADGHAHS